MYLGELKQITQTKPTWKGLRNWMNLLCSRSRCHAGCMTHSLKLSMEAQWFLAVPNRFATRVFQHRSYMFGWWFHFFIFHNINGMSSFPLTFIFSKMVETSNQYMFISHPQTYDDPQVQLPPCHSLGTKGGGSTPSAGCSHLVECDLGIHAGSLGLFLVDVQCLGFSCFSRFKCNIYILYGRFMHVFWGCVICKLALDVSELLLYTCILSFHSWLCLKPAQIPHSLGMSW